MNRILKFLWLIVKPAYDIFAKNISEGILSIGVVLFIYLQGIWVRSTWPEFFSYKCNAGMNAWTLPFIVLPIFEVFVFAGAFVIGITIWAIGTIIYDYLKGCWTESKPMKELK